jgi:hypothetical protein
MVTNISIRRSNINLITFKIILTHREIIIVFFLGPQIFSWLLRLIGYYCKWERGKRPYVRTAKYYRARSDLTGT